MKLSVFFLVAAVSVAISAPVAEPSKSSSRLRYAINAWERDLHKDTDVDVADCDPACY